MLRTAQADTFGPQTHGVFRVSRRIRVGAHLHFAILVGPAHNAAEVAADFRFHGGNIPFINGTGGTVQGNVVPFTVGSTVQFEFLFFFIYL